MTDINYFQNIPLEALNFIEKLNPNNNKNIKPSQTGFTKIGAKINMGYMCYVMKILKMTNTWESLSQEKQSEWINSLNSYQSNKYSNYENFYIDPFLIRYFDKPFTSFNLKSGVKNTANYILKQNFEDKNTHIFKTINADNKQTIATLSDVGFKNIKKPEALTNQYLNIDDYLNSFDWSQPWNAGAQFSSIAVYDSIFNLNLKNKLISFVENKLDFETGSYFNKKPSSSRQIINGAMKVITGLDWMKVPIHSPEKLIDFCLNNKPKFEGCDLVDYVYVLYKTSQQVNYRKKEISSVMYEVLQYLDLLYYKNLKGFSYYVKKSQTHYYGIKITKGIETPDIHGTILSIWAIVMILEVIEKNEFNYKVIKP